METPENPVDSLVEIAQSSSSFKRQLLQKLLQDDEGFRDDLIRQLSLPIKIKHDYYKPENGQVMKALIDEMIADKEDRDILFSDYPHLSANTLRSKLYNGLAYLLDNMDPDGIYAKWKEGIEIQELKRNKEKLGYTITHTKADISSLKFISHKRKPNKPVEHKVSLQEDTGPVFNEVKDGMSKWQQALIQFIEDETKLNVVITGLNLTIEDKEWLRNFFSPMIEKFVVNVMTERIKVIKEPNWNEDTQGPRMEIEE